MWIIKFFLSLIELKIFVLFLLACSLMVTYRSCDNVFHGQLNCPWKGYFNVSKELKAETGCLFIT